MALLAQVTTTRKYMSWLKSVAIGVSVANKFLQPQSTHNKYHSQPQEYPSQLVLGATKSHAKLFLATRAAVPNQFCRSSKNRGKLNSNHKVPLGKLVFSRAFGKSAFCCKCSTSKPISCKDTHDRASSSHNKNHIASSSHFCRHSWNQFEIGVSCNNMIGKHSLI